ncbi:MAG: hypothetical protein FWE36_08885 [Erysipelotrichales bacterium]|nr:hypothetical protein [Erysipelotrichales bacterium]
MNKKCYKFDLNKFYRSFPDAINHTWPIDFLYYNQDLVLVFPEKKDFVEVSYYSEKLKSIRNIVICKKWCIEVYPEPKTIRIKSDEEKANDWQENGCSNCGYPSYVIDYQRNEIFCGQCYESLDFLKKFIFISLNEILIKMVKK